jgi:coenzyme F420-0:L-glutamate ligase / coenzyme F420-1:gamma-L-glutamate ligase
MTDAIKNRRSIRKYLQRPVPQEVLWEILEAAASAPSAHNAQPWRFIILNDKAAKRGLAEAMATAWQQDLKKDGTPKETRIASAQASIEQFTNAPVLVVGCLTLKDMTQYPDAERQRYEHDLAVQSLSAAIQNILLTAHAEQLGACWYCAPLFCQKTVTQTLKLPEDVEPQALITFGYPAENPTAPHRKPLQNTVYLNEWGKKFNLSTTRE